MISDIVQEYRDVRAGLDAARKAFEKYEKSCKTRMQELEVIMLDKCNEMGVDSFSTENGTVFRTTKTYARLSQGMEAAELRQMYTLKTGDFGLFTAHVNKTHAKELLDAGVNLAEVGIDWVVEDTVQFRK